MDGNSTLSPTSSHTNDTSRRERYPSSTSVQSSDSWLDPSCTRKSANQIDDLRKQQLAIEYLSRLVVCLFVCLFVGWLGTLVVCLFS